jgi:hypothetical protein
VGESAAALLGGATLLVSACASEAPTTPETPEDEVGAIALTHGHRAVVTAAQLAAGGALRIEIKGESIHGHALDLLPDDLARIRRGEAVTVLSAPGWEDKHDHRVTFNSA